MLLLHRRLFRILANLIPEAYSKPCQTSKIIKNIDNPGTVRAEQIIQKFSGIFRDIQHMFRHIRIP